MPAHFRGTIAQWICFLPIIVFLSSLPAHTQDNSKITYRDEIVRSPRYFTGVVVDLQDSVFRIDRYEAQSDHEVPPEQTRYQLFGLDFTDQEKMAQFLTDRKLACVRLFHSEKLETIDCKASPIRGPVSAPNFLTNSRWLYLYHWLPQLGLAELTCNIDMDAEVNRVDILGYALYTCTNKEKDGSMSLAPIQEFWRSDF